MARASPSKSDLKSSRNNRCLVGEQWVELWNDFGSMVEESLVLGEVLDYLLYVINK